MWAILSFTAVFKYSLVAGKLIQEVSEWGKNLFLNSSFYIELPQKKLPYEKSLDRRGGCHVYVNYDELKWNDLETTLFIITVSVCFSQT